MNAATGGVGDRSHLSDVFCERGLGGSSGLKPDQNFKVFFLVFLFVWLVWFVVALSKNLTTNHPNHTKKTRKRHETGKTFFFQIRPNPPDPLNPRSKKAVQLSATDSTFAVPFVIIQIAPVITKTS
ncbi:MAG: hypothetical protein DMF63_13450 [Acidobacteria bacterium]|nr:MAG: hypothetical protein DMF63_13450 [Acidobacteriota bacterium]